MTRGVKKLGYLVLLSVLCGLLSGFMGIGESKPEETIQALIKAINDNDAEAFSKMVDIDSYFWRKSEKLGNRKGHSKEIRRLVEDGSFANTCRQQLIRLPMAPEWLEKAVVDKPESDVATAAITLPNGLESVLGLEKRKTGWVITAGGQNKKAAVNMVREVQAERAREEALQAQAREEEARKKKWEASARKTLQAVDAAVAAKNPEALFPLLDLPMLLRDRNSPRKTALALLDRTDKDAPDIKSFGELVRSGKLAGTPLPQRSEMSFISLFSWSSTPLAQAPLLTVSETVAVFQDGGPGSIMLLRETASAPWRMVYWRNVAHSDKQSVQEEYPWIERRKEAHSDEQRVQKSAQLLIDSYRAIRKEMDIIRQERIQALETLPPVLAAFAAALEKKDPDAVLAILDARGLAQTSTPTENKTSSKQVAPEAEAIRSIRAELAGKTLEKPLLGNLSPASLRKATFEAYTQDAAVANVPLPGKKGVYLGLARVQEDNASPWKIITAPQEAPFTDFLSHVKRYQAVIKDGVDPDQIVLKKLVDILAHKDGKLFLQHVDASFLRYGLEEVKKDSSSFLYSYSPYSNYDRFPAALLVHSAFPELMQPFKDQCATEISASGAFTFEGCRLTPELLEKATFERIGKILRVRVTPKKDTPFFLCLDGQPPRIMSMFSEKSENAKDVLDKMEHYGDIRKKIAQETPNFIKRTASQSCARALVDAVVLQDLTYTVKEHERTLILDVKAVALNQSPRPVVLKAVEWAVLNESKESVYHRIDYVTREEIKPNRPVKVTWTFNLNDESMWALERLRQGKGEFLFRPYEIALDDHSYARDNDSFDVEEQPDGRWRLPEALAVKPVPEKSLKVAHAISQTEGALLLKEKKRQEKLWHERARQLLAQVPCTVNSKGEFVFQNRLKKEVTIREGVLEFLEQGTLVKSFPYYINKDVPPQGQTTFAPGKDAQRFLKESDRNVYTAECRPLQVYYRGWTVDPTHPELRAGIVPPSLYQDDPVLFSWNQASLPANIQASLPESIPTSVESKKTAASKAPQAPSSATAPSAAEAAAPESLAAASSPTQAGALSAEQPVAQEGKKPGKAVFAALQSDKDFVGTTSFAADTRPDTLIRVAVNQPGAIITGFRIDNVGGKPVRWQTRAATSKAAPVAVMLGDVLQNPEDKAFAIALAEPAVVDLLVQDNGVIAEGKTRFRVTVLFKDGKRNYAVLEWKK